MRDTSEYEDREPIGLRESYLREKHRECPMCGRIMSKREGAEQGACNDCSGGAYDPSGTAL